MELKWNKYLSLFFLLSCLCIHGEQNSVQASKTPFSQNKWRELVKDKSYEEENIHTTTSKPKQALETNTKGLPSSIKYVIWVLALGVLLSLLFYLFHSMKGKKSIEIKPSLSPFKDIDRGLIDLSLFELEIAKQVQLENYRLAFRLRYLQLLKQLEAAQLIRYENEKTNSTYLAELTGHVNLYPLFQALSKKFDAVWYGHKPMNQLAYDEMSTYFDTCLDEILKHENRTV